MSSATSPESRPQRFSSPVWSHFTRIGNGLARCHECPVTLSHKTTITNLKKHFQKKHPHIEIGSVDPLRSPRVVVYDADKNSGDIEPIETAEQDDDDETITGDLNTQEIVLSKQDIQNAIKAETKACKSGEKDEKGRVSPGFYDQPLTTKTIFYGKRRSFVWRHFKKVAYGKAMCRYCHETYNCSTITNLKRHVSRKHPAEAEANEPYEDLEEESQEAVVKKVDAEWSEESSENLDITNLRDDVNTENNGEEDYEVVEYLEDSSIAKYLSSIASKPNKRIKLENARIAPAQVPDRLMDVVREVLDTRRDEHFTFGEYVANELRSIESLSAQLSLKKKIQDAIYDTKMEIFKQKETIIHDSEIQNTVQNVITVTSENSYTEIPINIEAS